MNWQTIFNPFSIFSEKQLTVTGLLLAIVGSLIGFLCKGSFNGTLDMHMVEASKLSTSFLENAINISVLTLLLIGLGKYFNPKTRFIDILNTAFWYRLPIYTIAILGYFLLPSHLNDRVSKNINTPEKIFTQPLEIAFAVLFGIAVLLCMAYSIVLIVNGFKTATNIKKWQHWVIFGFTILVSEGVTQFLIKQLL